MVFNGEEVLITDFRVILIIYHAEMRLSLSMTQIINSTYIQRKLALVTQYNWGKF